MAEAQEYRKPSTKPRTRIMGGAKNGGFIDNTGRENVDSQLVANQRVANTLQQSANTIRAGSAFSAPTTPTAGDRNPQVTPTASTPMGQFNSAGTTMSGQQGNTNSNEHLYGFAGDHFAFSDLPTVWQNPWLIVNAFLKDKGMNTPRLQEELRQYGDIGLPLFTMLKGLTDDPSDLSSSATINWISRWLNSMTTPGGNVPGYEQLLGNLLAARGDDTMLGEALNSGTGQDQVNTLMTYLRSALGTNTLNPIAASAILSQANREGDNFLGATMGGQDGYQRNFTDWLNSGGHRLFGS